MLENLSSTFSASGGHETTASWGAAALHATAAGTLAGLLSAGLRHCYFASASFYKITSCVTGRKMYMCLLIGHPWFRIGDNIMPLVACSMLWACEYA